MLLKVCYHLLATICDICKNSNKPIKAYTCRSWSFNDVSRNSVSVEYFLHKNSLRYQSVWKEMLHVQQKRPCSALGLI